MIRLLSLQRKRKYMLFTGTIVLMMFCFCGSYFLYRINTGSSGIWALQSDELQTELEHELSGKSTYEVMDWMDQHHVEYCRKYNDVAYTCKKQIYRESDPLSYVFLLEYVIGMEFENGFLVNIEVHMESAEP